jgi:nitroreductase/NAD-dependent dihydropyrimidine dehydrogenase PreA subunit
MTDWILIDEELCDNCGICVNRCMMCFQREGDKVVARADESCCNLCGHCVSLCPVGAVTHRLMDAGNFIDVGEGVNFDTDDFISFIRQRRSHRYFKKKEIPRDDLEKLVDACRYCPTGSNVQTVEIIVVQDPARIKKLSDLTIDFFDELGGSAAKKIEEIRAQGGEVPADLKNLESTLQYRERLLLARKIGFDAIFYRAPAVVIFHSPINTSTPKDNCVIASTTMGLLARTMKLETTYIGLFEAAAKGYEPLQKELDLPPGHGVFSVLIVGYPKLKFLKTVDRKPIKIRWE